MVVLAERGESQGEATPGANSAVHRAPGRRGDEGASDRETVPRLAVSPWTSRTLNTVYAKLRRKLIREQVPIDKGDVMYTCRHTFAKRMLGGYWTGKPLTIEFWPRRWAIRQRSAGSTTPSGATSTPSRCGSR